MNPIVMPIDPTIEWIDTEIDISIGQALRIVSTGAVTCWKQGGVPQPPVASPDGILGEYLEGQIHPTAVFLKLVGKIIGQDLEVHLIEVGSDFEELLTFAGRLYLAVNDISGAFLDNAGEFISTITLSEVTHDGPGSCPFCYTSKDSATWQNPISLLKGEKRLSETDLHVPTPAGSLDFIRVYRQSKQNDPAYQVLGAGWTHNHNVTLQEIAGTPNLIVLLAPSGGTVQFSQDDTDPDLYVGDPGSASIIEIDTGTSTARYTLTAQDYSQWIFDDEKRLRVRQLPSGETWTYTYTNDQLTSVEDNYGRELAFTYLTTGTFVGNLERVTDHTGRYVEFGYVEEHVDGVPVTPNPKGLLASVTDVLGHVWQYQYYGYVEGESNPDLLNFLVARFSPDYDMDGDGTIEAESAIVLEALTYQVTDAVINGITQQRGDGSLQASLHFDQQAGETTVTVAERQTQHSFVGGLLQSTTNPKGESSAETINSRFRPATKADANGNETTLAWSASGKLLNQVTDALNNVTAFSYDGQDRLSSSLDAEGRKTGYVYGDGNLPRHPTQIDVFDDAAETTLLQRQQFVYDSLGRVLEEKVIDPSDGTTVLRKTVRAYYTSGNGNGLLQTVTVHDLVTPANNQTTTYFYDAVGRTVQVNQSSLLGSCTKSYTVYDAAGNVVASICNYENAGAAPTTAEEAVALYDPDSPNQNRVTTHSYDTLGRRIQTTVNAGSSEEQSSLTVYDGLGRVVRSISRYVADPAIPNPFTADRDSFDHGADGTDNRISETVYDARGLVIRQINSLGDVTLYGYDDAGRQVRVIQRASQPDYAIEADAELTYYVPSLAADADIITASAYDANGNVVKTIDALGNVTFMVYDALNRVVKTIRNAKDGATVDLNTGDPGYLAANDPRSTAYEASDAPDRDLITRSSYDAMGRVVRTWDVLGNVTLFGYDELGRQVKTIRSASQPGYDLVSDPDLSAYSLDPAADVDVVSLTTYDELGQVVYSEDVNGTRQRSVYDGLGRQVRTIQNWVDNGVDPANWVWDSGDLRWENGSGSAIDHGQADQNIISETRYDTDGRVEWSQNVAGYFTRTVYDELGRQVRSIQNWVDNSVDPADWIWDATDDRWEDGSGNPINHGAETDQNIINETVYDDEGRVAFTRDWRGNETHFVYDAVGRRTQTITNYGDGVYDPQVPDEDLVSETIYDYDGRVAAQIDAAGRVTQLVYDGLGRRVKTISNFVDGSFNPAYPDEDLVSETIYNKAGQVVATVDPRGTRSTFSYDAAGRRVTVTQAADTKLATTTYTCYDKAGRVQRVIRNWLDDGRSPDAKAADGSWIFDPTEHGPNHDRNLSMAYSYDLLGRVMSTTDSLGQTASTTYAKDGRVLSSTDVAGISSANAYDRLRRTVRVVQNWVDNGIDPSTWVWNATHERWEDPWGTPVLLGYAADWNIIVDTAYDLLGRRAGMRDPRGYLTSYAYDRLGRRTSLTNPLAQVWSTAYDNAGGGTSQVVQTNPLEDDILQVFDRVGRLQNIVYASADTPDVQFSYDAAGNRVLMEEGLNDFSTIVRRTHYHYDDANRLTRVELDSDGDGQVEQAVEYAYEAGGQRTSLRLPDGLTLHYSYDAKGRLIALTDWANHTTTYRYDLAGRLAAMQRADNYATHYHHDVGGRLTQIEHRANGATLGRFAFTLDARGNRTQSVDLLRRPDAEALLIDSDHPAVSYMGTWSSGVSTAFDAKLNIKCYGDSFSLTLGTHPDGSIVDVSMDGQFLQGVDTYAATPATKTVTLRAGVLGSHTLEVRNRPARNRKATPSNPAIFRVEFVSLSTVFAGHAIDYDYDGLARLREARYVEAYGQQTRNHNYRYDEAGNRRQATTLTPSETTVDDYWVDEANRLVASDITTPTYDIGPGDVAGLLAALETALAGSGGTIRLAPGSSYILTNVYDNSHGATGLPLIDKSIVIEGQGAILRRDTTAPSFRFFRVLAGGDLTLNDLTLINGLLTVAGSGGAAIRAEGPVTLNRVVVAYNTSYLTGSPGVYCLDDLTATDCWFVHNRQFDSVAQAGSISLPDSGTGTALLTNCIFAHNQGYRGGALALGRDTQLVDCTLTHNQAVEGGAIYLASGTLVIYNAMLSNNHATTNGAGIYNVSGVLDLTNSRLVHNTLDASGQGGAMFNTSEATDPAVGTGNETILATNNWIVDNADAVKNANSNGLLLLENNWWGAADGPSGVGGGSGDAVSSDVDFTPYLTSPASNTYTYTPPVDEPPGSPTRTFSYDDTGQTLSDGSLTYTWDRAGRLKTVTDSDDTYQYAYNGLSQRMQQTVDSMVTDYLLDTQPALPQVLAATTDAAATTRYVHNPLGAILSQHDAAGAWHWALVDGVGSVRGMVDDGFVVEGSRGFAPYGLPIDGAGSVTMPFAFTGEPLDGNGLQYHRARYYNPLVGVFPSLDPLELGNRYAYVGGNVVNRVDPSGMSPSCSPHCPSGSQLTFHLTGFPMQPSWFCKFPYYRELAAYHAHETAKTTPASLTTNKAGATYYSAMFISESLVAGNFPMTICSSGSSDCGWRRDRSFNGNAVWRNHVQNRNSRDTGITGYLRGQPITGANAIPELKMLGGLYPIRISADDIPLTDMQTQTLFDFAPSDFAKLNQAMARLVNIGPGDYLHVDAFNAQQTHGWMITGYGPAVSCGNPALAAVSFNDLATMSVSTALGRMYTSLDFADTPLSTYYSTNTSLPEVLYVADEGQQSNTSRPFYCTKVRTPSNERLYLMHQSGGAKEWEFYKVPNEVSVPIDMVYVP